MFESPTNLTGSIIQQAAIGSRHRSSQQPDERVGRSDRNAWFSAIKRLIHLQK